MKQTRYFKDYNGRWFTEDMVPLTEEGIKVMLSETEEGQYLSFGGLVWSDTKFEYREDIRYKLT